MKSASHPPQTSSCLCALVTLAAVPLFFLDALYVCRALPGPTDLNTAGVTFYSILCLVLALPLAFANSVLIAPYVARRARGRFPALGAHLVLVVVWAALVLSCYLVVPQLPAAPNRLLVGVTLFWYLAILLGPAVIAGSFVYCLQYHSLRTPRRTCRRLLA